MISRRASHKLVDGRHAYCHVVIHRTEQRKDSRQRTHSVYLVRLLAHIGEFPSPDTFYELRYSSLERLHQQLRASRPRLRLPELPRARRLGNQHPSYVEQMSAALQDYLRRLLEGDWPLMSTREPEVRHMQHRRGCECVVGKGCVLCDTVSLSTKLFVAL